CSRRDLQAVYVAAVPQRFEDAVTEAKGQDILDCFFAEVVIDAIDVRLAKNLVQLIAQCTRALQVMAKRLFYYDTAPSLARGQPGFSYALDHRLIVARLRREIEQYVAVRVPMLFYRLKPRRQRRERFGRRHIAG